MRARVLSIQVLTAALAGPLVVSAQVNDAPWCQRLAFESHQYVTLETLVARASQFEGACVRTRGRLVLRGRERPREDELRGPWILELQDPDSAETLTLSPGAAPEQFDRDVLSLVGHMVEVAGLFSAGPPPSLRFRAYMAAPERTRGARTESLSPCDAMGSADAYIGRTVIVWGPFRGRNVFRDLPEDTRPDVAAWVVGDEDCAVWITGRPPSGEGFSLDGPPATVRWVKVEGKLQRRAAAVVLRASKVTLARPRD